MGRVSLPRLPCRKRSRAACQIRQAVGSLLPGNGGGVAPVGTEPFRPRWRARHPGRRDIVVRRAADAAAPGGKPHQEARHRELPRSCIMFDLLATPSGDSLLQTPLLQRREALDAFFRSIGPNDAVRLSPFTRDIAEASRWLETSGGALDGVIAKRLDARCSKSRNGAPRIVSSAGSATSGILRWSALCSLASTTAKASWITSGLPRPCTISTARR